MSIDIGKVIYVLYIKNIETYIYIGEVGRGGKTNIS